MKRDILYLVLILLVIAAGCNSKRETVYVKWEDDQSLRIVVPADVDFKMDTAVACWYSDGANTPNAERSHLNGKAFYVLGKIRGKDTFHITLVEHFGVDTPDPYSLIIGNSVPVCHTSPNRTTRDDDWLTSFGGSDSVIIHVPIGTTKDNSGGDMGGLTTKQILKRWARDTISTRVYDNDSIKSFIYLDTFKNKP